MFIGHYAAGLAAKRVAPEVSLGALFFAAQFLDLLWPLLLLAGIERVEVDPGNTAFTPLAFVHYPVSHSLLTTLGWAALVAFLYRALRPRTGGAFWLGALVASHWLLDALTHRPDLPLYPGGGQRVGLTLWNSVAGTLLVESLLFAIGVLLYVRRTRAKDRAGSYGFWALVAFLSLVYAANLLGPPPPDARTIAIVALSQWLIVLWGYWVDRHREVKPA